MHKIIKLKSCKVCDTEFKPFKTTQKVCGWECADKYGKEKVEKDKAKDNRKAKRALNENDKGYQLDKTQVLFNRYIRFRDRNNPCISCDRHHSGQYHAGHYRTVGANPELRFDERNCHKQCSACNNHLSGNIVNYRINLIRKLGIDEVESVEGPHEPKRYTIEQLKELQLIYKAKIKELENAKDICE